MACRLRSWLTRSPIARAAALSLMLAVMGCAAPARTSAPAFGAPAPAHRINVVFHGWHSGIALPAADLPPQAWPAQRDFPNFEHFEVGWGDRAYYMAPEGSLWLGLRALLWPTPGVLHVAAFNGPPERYFAEAAVVELDVSAAGFAALVAAVRDSHERAPAPLDRFGRDAQPSAGAPDWPPSLGPGQHGASRFYASRERFHLFRTCNVWVASVLAVAGVPLRPAAALSAGALFAQLRPHGRVLRAPP